MYVWTVNARKAWRPVRCVPWLVVAAALLGGTWLQYSEGREVSTHMASLPGKVIVVDPGHGGRDPGVIGRGAGTLEKDITLGISLKLAGLFTNGGAEVLLIRSADVDLSGDAPLGEKKRTDLVRRVELINESGADVCLSIHGNGTGSSRWRGAQLFYPAGSDAGPRLLAETIQQELTAVLRNTDRQPIATDRQFLLRESRVPMVTVEVGFLSNPDEERLLAQDAYQQKIAWAIFRGVARYFAEAAGPAAPVVGRSVPGARDDRRPE